MVPALLIIIFWSAYIKDEIRLFHVIIKVYLTRKLPLSASLLSTSDTIICQNESLYLLKPHRKLHLKDTKPQITYVISLKSSTYH